MKKLLNNKKGFTLIELLAVIVILAILVMVAIHAVTKYLTESRKGTFSDSALSAISTVRNDVILNQHTQKVYYDLTSINKLLEKKLNKSPFGNQYTAGYIKVDYSDTGSTYSICLTDGVYGIAWTEENSVSKDSVSSDNITCAAPSGYTQITVS